MHDLKILQRQQNKIVNLKERDKIYKCETETCDKEFKNNYGLTVVEQKDYHFLAVATVSDLENSYCNQWPHPYEPQNSCRFVSSAVCLHFTAK